MAMPETYLCNDMIPRDREGNLEFRQWILNWAAGNPDRQAQVRAVCSKDILFWVNAFVCGEDPRLATFGLEITPFITWPKQEYAILSLHENLGIHDMRIVKSRGEGGSFIGVIVGLHAATFRANIQGIYVSRRKDFVDDRNNPKALLPKIDFIHRMCPAWLRGNLERRDMARTFTDTNSMLSGETATGAVARAARPTFVWFDESNFWASQADMISAWEGAQAATNCRISCSTVNGPATHHADLARNQKVVQIVMDWKDNPTHARGLYQAKDDKVQHLDPTFRLPDTYPFIYDGRVRSAYYDEQCARANDPVVIARELDMDEGASRRTYFDPPVLMKHAELYGKVPTYVGDLEFDPITFEPIRFVENPKGKISIWGQLERDAKGEWVPPPSTKYAHAADVSGGSKWSNSVISVGEIETGIKRAEIVASLMNPTEFGQLGLATARWFNNAYVGFDGAGVCGQNYGQVFINAGYPSLHYHVNEGKANATPGDKIGIFLNPGTRMHVLFLYRDSIARANDPNGARPGSFLNPSITALTDGNECLAYEWLPDGTVDHKAAQTREDASGAKKNHGDRAMADAMLCYLMSKTRVAVEIPVPYALPPEGSFAAMYRMEEIEAQQRKNNAAFAPYDYWNGHHPQANPFDAYSNFGSKWRNKRSAVA